MINCKRCGAIVGADHIFCGKCGEPVNREVSEKRVIKVKRPRKIFIFEKKLLKSKVFVGVFSGIWAVLSAVLVFLLTDTLRGIKAASSSIGVVVSQLLYKYEYVKEGLSLSYISAEFSSVINYGLDWAFLVLNIILIAVSFLLFLIYLMKFISMIRKLPTGKKTDSLRRTVAKTGLISIGVYIILVIISLVLKGIV